jgi:hypothetical protein
MFEELALREQWIVIFKEGNEKQVQKIKNSLGCQRNEITKCNEIIMILKFVYLIIQFKNSQNYSNNFIFYHLLFQSFSILLTLLID